MAVIILLFYMAVPYIVEHSASRNAIVRLFEYSYDADISNGRFEIWQNAMAGFTENPFWGKGWSWYRNTYGMGAHNIYIQLLCECGVAGAIPVITVLIGVFVYTHKVLKRSVKENNDIKIAINKFGFFTQTYILIYGFTGNPIYNYSFFIWYTFSLCILANKMRSDDCNRSLLVSSEK